MKKIKAYKVFDKDLKCRDFQYEVGKEYKHDGDVGLCSAGFHACERLIDCFNYYNFDPNNRVCEVLMSGNVIQGDDKSVCSVINIVKEISWEKVLTMVNTGNGNSGYGNSGDLNSGDRNSGYGNSGDLNSGDWNSGNRNSGHFNNTTPNEIRVFGKPCKFDDWNKSKKPNFIYNIRPTEWVDYSSMSEKEKEKYPNADVSGGYLKEYTYKEAWEKAYKNRAKDDIKLLKALPNFDAEIFEDITGIKIK